MRQQEDLSEIRYVVSAMPDILVHPTDLMPQRNIREDFDFRHYFQEDQDEFEQEEYLEGNLPSSIQNKEPI